MSPTGSQHNGAIGNLPDAKRAQFYMIWQQAKVPEPVAMIMPSQITAAKSNSQYPKHLYATKGRYPVKLTGWEADALKAELAKSTLVGWYRNPIGGTAAIAVPYIQSGITRTMYPDFVLFHQVGKKILIDIVDPHRPDQGDAGPKWTGLARYAKAHTAVLRRVVAVIKNADGALMSLDLKNPSVAIEMATASNETDVRNIFGKFGGTFFDRGLLTGPVSGQPSIGRETRRVPDKAVHE